MRVAGRRRNSAARGDDPRLTEFSEYGGVHRIDGRSTGVLPDRIARFGVGIARRREMFP